MSVDLCESICQLIINVHLYAKRLQGDGNNKFCLISDSCDRKKKFNFGLDYLNVKE